MREISDATRLLLDPGNPLPDITFVSVFQLIDGTALDSSGKSLNNFAARAMPNAAGVLTATLDNRRKARYVMARLLVDAASRGFTSSSPPFESTVFINIPIKPTADGTRAVPFHVSEDMIYDPQTLINHLTNTTGGTVPHIRSMKTSTDTYAYPTI